MAGKEEIKEKAEEIAVKHAKTYTVSRNNSHKNNILFNESSIVECEAAANEMAIWVQKTMIEKACKYIYSNAHVTTFGDIRLEKCSITEFIDDFKKAMEE